VARTIATELSFGRRPQDIFAMEARINEVTSAQIQAFAKQYFDPDQMFTVVVGSNPERLKNDDLWVIAKDDLAFDSINLRR
jgi:predicted Zn-dependent peptidase